MKIKASKSTVAVLLAMMLSPALALAHPVPSAPQEHGSVIRDHSSRPHVHESAAHH